MLSDTRAPVSHVGGGRRKKTTLRCCNWRIDAASATLKAVMDLTSLIDRRLTGSLDAIRSLRDQAPRLVAVIAAIEKTIRNTGVVYTCGNGGSAAEAMHLAEELIGRYRADRPPLPAVCLNADPTALTCIANDFGFDEVFARQIAALMRPADALVVFSTSGNSRNILAALDASHKARAVAVGLLGKGGGGALERCDHALVVNSDDTAHIQEAHQVALHLILEALERPGATP